MSIHQGKIILARAALRATPISRQVFPACSRRDVPFRITFGLIVNVAADTTFIFIVIGHFVLPLSLKVAIKIKARRILAGEPDFNTSRFISKKNVKTLDIAKAI
jgi:hypothetical protein